MQSFNRKHSPSKEIAKNRDIEHREFHETTYHHNFVGMEGSQSHVS
jgi:hypothetical protein